MLNKNILYKCATQQELNSALLPGSKKNEFLHKRNSFSGFPAIRYYPIGNIFLAGNAADIFFNLFYLVNNLWRGGFQPLCLPEIFFCSAKFPFGHHDAAQL